MLASSGRFDEAEALLNEVVLAGDAALAPRAVLALGRLLVAGGRIAEARVVLGVAAAGADPDVAAQAAQLAAKLAGRRRVRPAGRW